MTDHSKEAKFVSICCSRDDYSGYPHLFAVDAIGIVYEYDREGGVWNQLSRERRMREREEAKQ